jgi:hypothetical protein
MPEAESTANSTEPVVSHIPTAELKRILTEQFRRQVVDDIRKKFLRPFALISLPGIAIAGGIMWKVVDNSMKGYVDEASKERIETLRKSADQTIATHRRELTAELQTGLATVITGHHQAAIAKTLQDAVANENFQAQVNGRVTAAISSAWTQQRAALEQEFSKRIMEDRQFREAVAEEVRKAFVSGRALNEIIASSLEMAIRSARVDDAGQAVTLALLAAVDPKRANAVIHFIVKRSDHDQAIALQALNSVNFAGMNDDDGLLADALALWESYCTTRACAQDSEARERISNFLKNGGELQDDGRARWTQALRLWHEQLVAGQEIYREASLDLVPQALRRMGTPEASEILLQWLTGANAQLSLSATTAIAAQTDRLLPDERRLALFRSLWTKMMAGAPPRERLADAIWVAINEVSGGGADPFSFYRHEAKLIAEVLPRTGAPRHITDWMRSRRITGRPQPVACAGRTDTPDTDTAVEMRRRADLCALIALARPEDGNGEWNQLRQSTRWDDHPAMATLGLIWASAAVRGNEATMHARLAPVEDLLKAQSPIPREFRLAAMMILRTARAGDAWQRLATLDLKPDDAGLFLVGLNVPRDEARQPTGRSATRGVPQLVPPLLDPLRKLPDHLRGPVTAELVAALNRQPPKPLAETIEDAMRAIQPGTVSAETLAAVSAIRLAHAVAPRLVLAAAERSNAFVALDNIVSGAATAPRQRRVEARVLIDELLAGSVWQRVGEAEVPAISPAGPVVTLKPSLEDGLGRVRLAEGTQLRLRAPRGQSVVFHHPTTRETRVLDVDTPWSIGNQASDTAEEWLFRLESMASADIALAEPETLVPARTGDGADAPAIRTGQTYRVSLSRRTPNEEAVGRIRLNVQKGQSLVFTTFGLASRVDTVVSIVRNGATLEEDDDNGEEDLASLLRWQADRDGPVTIELKNIGNDGRFYLRAEVE